ncbi:hypothetical protein [Puniceicoccus vermicola]|uniref:Verru_Chthon cassette protein A n=1 Tax=Puniceicoccus vermicola TaxID=388746 RepID=A0A7X1B011_9BACT|nr:hypothetical protein [Puniceicoccus vermicola]MBC2602949.1 hypothetical protein [Puniceicoccus vermicola]
MLKKSECRRPRHKRGFALIIALALMAFMLLLLLALGGMLRVESSTLQRDQEKLLARANTQLGLALAVGDLQRLAGPDQRITAPADLVADIDSEGVATSSPNGINVQPGTRYWTGVWGNRNPDISYALTPDQIDADDTEPALLNWLVSGNESTRYEQLLGGGVVPDTASRFSPATTVQGFGASSDAFSRPGFSSGSGVVEGVVLVGSNTVSSGSPAHAQESFDRGNYVVAPLVDLEADGQVRGRYAWWVGDEGVKARIDLQNGYQLTGESNDQINSFITSQRSGVEFMDQDIAGTAQLTGYAPESPLLGKVLTQDQLPLVGADAAAQANLAAGLPNRFHDITTYSYGILSDTYAGGLKKDLTADLADTSTNFDYRPADSDPVFPPVNPGEQNLPTWGQLRAWARTNPDPDSDVVDTSTVQAHTAGIAPVIQFAAVGMNYMLSEDNGSGDREVTFALYPMVVLFNPYSYPIKAADYDVGIRFGKYSGATDARNTFQIRVKDIDIATYDPDEDEDRNDSYDTVGYIDLNAMRIYPDSEASQSQPDTFLRLRISAEDQHGTEQDILPGQRFAYMLTSFAVNEYSHANPPELHRVDSIQDEITNYFTLPPRNFPGVFADPNDHIILYGNEGAANNPHNNPTSLRYMESSITLADAGDLSSTDWATNFPRFRSAAYNIMTMVVQGVKYQRFCVNEAESIPQSIYDRVMDESPQAKTAWRYAALNEKGGYWAKSPLAGQAWGKTIRYLADANLRAPHIMGTAYENDNALSLGDSGPRYAARPFGAVISGGRPEVNSPPYPGILLDSPHYSFGFQNPGSMKNLRAVLFDLLPSPDRLLSLGQLQHVPWARYSFHGINPFANSYAPLRIARDSTYRENGVRRPGDLVTNGVITPASDPFYDLPWLLNRAMWDRYFVSGIPAALNTVRDVLPNSRMTVVYEDTTPEEVRYSGSGNNQAYDKASANLMVQGAFNINSTSEQAWRAILAGPSGLPQNSDYAESDDNVETSIPYPRFSRNLTALAVDDGPYSGFTSTMTLPSEGGGDIRAMIQMANRGLYLNTPDLPGNSSPQAVVNELARSIVNEIRLRGPFLSLADFVNRPLSDPSEPAGIKGTLQAGLDNMDPAVAQVNPDFLIDELGGKVTSFDSSSYYAADYLWDSDHFMGGTETGRGEISKAPWAMSPLQLTQADLLSSLGPLLSARSDTFTIRTYGEKQNPATGVVEGRAWCEAVVQRMPGYIGNEPSEAPISSLGPLSASFGRRFEIISFRYLNPSEI